VDERDLRRRYPGLVCTSITGYGLDGPYAGYQWCDLTGMALGGFMYLIGDPDRPPVVFRAPQAYFMASTQAATGTALALFHRTRTGRGQLVDVSMQEAVTFALNGPGGITSWWSGHKTNIGREGGSLNWRYIRWRVMLPCKDGYTANSGILGGANRFPKLVEVMKADNAAGDLEDPKWLNATSFPPPPGWWQCNQEQLDHAYDLFTRWQMKHTKAEIMALAIEHGLLVYPVNTAADLLASPQLQARAAFVDIPHPELGRSLRYAGPPYRLSLTPARIASRAPLLGEQNVDIWTNELGVDRHQLATLAAAGVV
jgi:crotonobetainyl-CoA:carnitine CoA-transferase CaiB-like acyl-CoA transferase